METRGRISRIYIGTVFWFTCFLGFLIVFCTNSIVKRLDHNAALADIRSAKQTDQLARAVQLQTTLQAIQDLKDEAINNQHANEQLRAMITVQKAALEKKTSLGVTE